MVVSKSQFKRLPTKPTSISRSRNPIRMKCNRGNFQCGATCKPIINKRTGGYTRCPSNKALGMAQSGLAWLKDREERLGKVNDRRIAQGKSKLRMTQGRLDKPEPIARGYQTPDEWTLYLEERGLNRTQFNMLPKARQQGLIRGYTRSMRELRAAAAKDAREQARNAAIKQEVAAAKTQTVSPPTETPPAPQKTPPKPILKDKKGTKTYSGQPTSKQEKAALVIVGKLNENEDFRWWMDALDDETKVLAENTMDAVADADPRWVLDNEARLKGDAFRRNFRAIAKELNASDKPTKFRKADNAAVSASIVNSLFNGIGQVRGVKSWQERLKFEGKTNYADFVGRVAEAVSKANPEWIVANQPRLDPREFRSKVRDIAKELNVSWDTPRTTPTTKKRTPTPAQRTAAENILENLIDRMPSNPEVSATGWAALLKKKGKSGYASYVNQVLNALKKADPIWILDNRDLLKISNFKMNVEAIGEKLGIPIEFGESA